MEISAKTKLYIQWLWWSVSRHFSLNYVASQVLIEHNKRRRPFLVEFHYKMSPLCERLHRLWSGGIFLAVKNSLGGWSDPGGPGPVPGYGQGTKSGLCPCPGTRTQEFPSFGNQRSWDVSVNSGLAWKKDKLRNSIEQSLTYCHSIFI